MRFTWPILLNESKVSSSRMLAHLPALLISLRNPWANPPGLPALCDTLHTSPCRYDGPSPRLAGARVHRWPLASEPDWCLPNATDTWGNSPADAPQSGLAWSGVSPDYISRHAFCVLSSAPLAASFSPVLATCAVSRAMRSPTQSA